MVAFTGVCFYLFIFPMCSCGNVTAVSVLVRMASTAMSSANVNILLLIVVGMLAMYSVCNIGPKRSACSTPTLISFTSEYTSFIFTTKVLLLRYDLSKWWICSGKCFLIVCKRLSWFTLSNANHLLLDELSFVFKLLKCFRLSRMWDNVILFYRQGKFKEW